MRRHARPLPGLTLTQDVRPDPDDSIVPSVGKVADDILASGRHRAAVLTSASGLTKRETIDVRCALHPCECAGSVGKRSHLEGTTE